MKRFLFFALLALSPLIGFSAEDSISFAPPVGDASVVYLGNIFGQVDGVLHGSGSHIMGRMFAVFNAAVLALGGMIITYTLLVSTMNTAQEGEMLGKKWSSIWVPLRATGGMALLMPKASGYCMLQVFVMWIVVQGVGAADKVWNAALDYLNRGGVVIHAQTDPTKSLIDQGKQPAIGKGASAILQGQVCMQGLQNLIEKQLAELKKLAEGEAPSGACFKGTSGGPALGPDNPWARFKTVLHGTGSSTQGLCMLPIPDFISSVDIVSVYKDGGTSITMPNFPADNPLALINGICGEIHWTNDRKTTAFDSVTSLTKKDKTTLGDTRGVAIQQMYFDLSDIARVMIANNPYLNSYASGKAPLTRPWAIQPFGQPVPSRTASLSATSNCGTTTGTQCTQWAADGAALFTGSEFQNAIADYHGVMRPYLNLKNEIANSGSVNLEREFIDNAESTGWIFAGSYFFDVVRLNGAAAGSGSGAGTDTNSGLGGSTSTVDVHLNKDVLNLISSKCQAETSSPYSVLCPMFYSDVAGIKSLQSMMGSKTDKPISYLATTNPTALGEPSASTVYGFIDNSSILAIPGEKGTSRLSFANLMKFDFKNQNTSLPPANFPCGGVHLLFVTICIGEMFGTILYNGIMVPMMQLVGTLLMPLIEQLIMSVLTVPLAGIGEIFKQGIDILDTPGINPIVALANMGTYYINFAGQLVFTFINFLITSSLTFGIGLLLMPVIALVMPIVFAWLGVMVSVGMVTAYYIPLLPYMIFTFGAIAWFMAVIEAMVAAPIVALGVTHPEGHEVFGKGEAAIMIMVNVFLRPTMMVIGFIAGIALSYVGVWVLNAGFDRAIGFMQTGTGDQSFVQGSAKDKAASGAVAGTAAALAATGVGAPAGAAVAAGAQAVSAIKGAVKHDAKSYKDMGEGIKDSFHGEAMPPMTLPGGAGTVKGGYTGWAGVFSYFMSVIIYTTIYMTIVEKAFSLIVNLPDKVLRWIGGHPESYGQETSQWAEQSKGKIQEGGKELQQGQAQMQKQLASAAAKGAKAKMGGDAGSASASGGDAPSGGGGSGGGGGEPPA